MGLLVILFVMIAVSAGFFYLLGRDTARNRDGCLKRHPVAVKIFLWLYVVFAGCFVFPVRSEQASLDFTKIYLLIVSYGIIGLGFAGVYGTKKEKVIYPLVLVFTAAGMACRYLLEYGEVSNSYNFIIHNIMAYLALIPLFTVLAYHYIVEYLVSKK
ncbi:hypothetical protein [Eisenbergiella porci]|uniref:hypothetical protein n=1 Tax=Eisenbergiella porci TaxID=2652274 RepID=UPI002A80982C|nr:hypothetical protein [Eisenbergiella porci]